MTNVAWATFVCSYLLAANNWRKLLNVAMHMKREQKFKCSLASRLWWQTPREPHLPPAFQQGEMFLKTSAWLSLGDLQARLLRQKLMYLQHPAQAPRFVLEFKNKGQPKVWLCLHHPQLWDLLWGRRPRVHAGWRGAGQSGVIILEKIWGSVL